LSPVLFALNPTLPMTRRSALSSTTSESQLIASSGLIAIIGVHHRRTLSSVSSQSTLRFRKRSSSSYRE